MVVVSDGVQQRVTGPEFDSADWATWFGSHLGVSCESDSQVFGNTWWTLFSFWGVWTIETWKTDPALITQWTMNTFLSASTVSTGVTVQTWFTLKSWSTLWTFDSSETSWTKNA
jgi:hypothetical protein